MESKSIPCLIDVDNPERVKDFTEAFLKLGEEVALSNVYYIIGRAYQKLYEKDKGIEYNWNKAIEYFDKAIKNNPYDYHSFQAKGTTLERIGGWCFRLRNIKKVEQFYRMAIESFTKAIEINPYFAWAYNNRGCTYRLLAVRTIKPIEELNEENEDIQKYFRKAQEDHNRAIELNDGIIIFYVNRASNTYFLNYLTLCSKVDKKRVDEINKEISKDLYLATFLARQKEEIDKLKKELEPRYTPLLRYIKSELFAPYLEGDPGNSLGWIVK